MMRETLALLGLLLLSLVCLGQPLDSAQYERLKAQIQEAMSAEDYPAALPLLEAQFGTLRAASACDSLYLYLYDYGRSAWKVHGKERGIEQVQKLHREIRALDPDTAHWLDAMENLSMLLYEANHNDRFAHDEALLELAKTFSRAQPMQRSTAHYNLGFNKLELGQPTAAIAQFQKAIDVLDPDQKENVKRLVDAYNAIGAAVWRTGDLQRAKSAYRKSIAYNAMLDDPFTVLANRSNALGNLSLIFQDEGQLITARGYLYDAIDARKSAIAIGGDPSENDHQQRLLMSHYRNLAAIYLGMGDNDRALQLTRHLHSMQKDALDAEHPSRKLTDESFGSIYAAMGAFDTALVYLRRYTAFTEQYYGQISFQTGAAYKRIGDIELKRGAHAAAVWALDEAIVTLERVSAGIGNQDLPGTYLLRARAHRNLGNRDAAVRDHRSAIAQYRAQRSRFDPRLGEAYIALAQTYRRFGAMDSASSSIDSALTILEGYQLLLSNREATHEYNPVLFLPEALFEKAGLMRQQTPGAGTDSLALAILRRAAQILRNTKNAFEGDGAQLELYASHQRIFDSAQEIAYDLYRQTGDSRYVHEMLAFSEEQRTLLLRRQINAFGATQYHGVPDSIVRAERELINALSGKSINADASTDYAGLQARYQKLQAEIAQRYPQYYTLRFEEHTADVREIREKLLLERRTLVQYIATDEELFAIVVTPDSLYVKALSTNGLEHLLHRYSIFIEQLEVEPFAQVAAGVYQALFAPIEPLITTDEVLVVPDKYLFNVNFETLVKPAPEPLPHYLIRDYTISYLLSSTSAVRYQQLQEVESSGVLAFAPGFSDSLKNTYRNSFHRDAGLIDHDYMHCIQQPFAVRTAQTITQLIPGRAFVGAHANEHSFKENAKSYRVIHLGTHTQINNTTPLLSRLILAKSPKDTVQHQDGYLHAYEIYNLQLEAELAVLTACETGVGEVNRSEGVLSLSHGFAYAGCPSVIMSLWQIDEKSSAEIIETFYRYLADGMDKSAALRRAKLSYLDGAKDQLRAPYFWAGMVLVGNPDAIVEEPESWWWFLALAGLLIGVGLFLRNRWT